MGIRPHEVRNTSQSVGGDAHIAPQHGPPQRVIASQSADWRGNPSFRLIREDGGTDCRVAALLAMTTGIAQPAGRRVAARAGALSAGKMGRERDGKNFLQKGLYKNKNVCYYQNAIENDS